MQHKAFLTIFLLYCSGVQAAVEWNDFTNNFATDLAPLITLFGEQVTKQFLSESLTVWDNIIFSMAPLGLLTAVVSVIRVCGSPSMRAFIGRAQEGPGIAEAELLSCTSETVAEVYSHEGGIARVFGEPRILEILVARPKEPGDSQNNASRPTISTLQDANLEHPDKAAYRQTSSSGVPLDLSEIKRISRQHRPNLSLNAGIVRYHKGVAYFAAILGIVLQIGVLVFAAITIYVYPDSFPTAGFGGDERPAEAYTFVLTLVGTLLTSFGIFLCAFIIERSSNEIRFRRNEAVDGKVYWIQPGGQKIGDQAFGSYIGSFDGREYIISTKSTYRNEPLLWLAVTSPMIGFVTQFIGLRGMHASVTLAQIGATMIMAIIRAMLRSQRLHKSGDVISSLGAPSKEGNLHEEHPFIKDPSLLFGHELDLFTMKFHEIEGVYISVDRESRLQRAIQTEVELKQNLGSLVLDTRSRLAEYTGMPGVSRRRWRNRDPIEVFPWNDLKVRSVAYKLKAGIDAAFKIISQLPITNTGSRWNEEDEWSINLNLIKPDPEGQDRRRRRRRPGRDQDKEPGETHKVYLQFGKGASTAHRVPRGPQQLESILGLWALTLNGLCAKQNETEASNITLRAVCVAKYGDGVPVKSFETLWYCWGKEYNMLEHAKMYRKGIGYVKKEDPLGIERPIFGVLSPPPQGQTVRVFYIRTNNSPLQMCSQDIYMSFLKAALQNAESIGGETSLRRLMPLELEHTTIEALAESFEKAQLGSRDDAYICIFAVLRELKILPGPREIVRSLLKEIARAGKMYYSHVRAVRLIQFMYEHPVITGCKQEVALTALGDFSITIAQDPNPEVAQEGLRFLVELLEQNRSSPVVQKFAWVGLQIADKRGLSDYKNEFQKAGLIERITEDFLEGSVNFLNSANFKVEMTSLSWAAWNSDYKMVGWLLQKGADPWITHDHLKGPIRFLRLAQSNSLQLMKHDHQPPDFDIQDDMGMTALCWAAWNGNHKMAKWLLQRGADPWIADKDQRTALSFAAENGLHRIVEYILSDPNKKEEINSRSIQDQRTALMFAAANGHLLTVEHLLKVEEDYISRTDYNGDNALMLASARGHVPVIGCLLAVHNRRMVNGDQRSALHLASEGGFERAVDILVTEFSDTMWLNGADKNGSTPLHLAAKGGHWKVVGILLERGADSDLEDNDFQTALTLSLKSGKDYEEVVRLLLQKGCDLKAVYIPKDKKTPFQQAVEDNLTYLPRLNDMIVDERRRRRAAAAPRELKKARTFSVAR